MTVRSAGPGSISLGSARASLRFEIAGWCAFYVVVFTLIQVLDHGPGNLVNDTLEAYAWGQELQFGYSKHPFFWAWVAYGWFKVLPTADWAFYLLASVNAAVGLACTWFVARRFLPVERATGAVLCLLITTTYVCFVQRFNANTILVSLWPATTLAVLRAVERDRLIDGVIAGLLAAFCMLSKYQSAIFLLVLFAAVYFIKGSARPYVGRAALACFAVGLLALVPHLIWLQHNDYLPIAYAQLSGARPWATVARESATFLLTSAGFVGVGVLAYAWAGGGNWWRLPAAFTSGFRGQRGAVAILVFGVEALTIAICLARSTTLKPIYAIPMYFMLPVWLAMASELPFDARALRRLRYLVGGIFLGGLLAAPVVGIVIAKANTRLASQPKDDVILAITDEWHRRYNMPLRIVGGDEDYAISAPFYSTDHPSYLIGFDRRVLGDFNLPMSNGPAGFVAHLSPWIDTAAIKRDGLAIVCSEESWSQPTGCLNEAARWLGEKGVSFELAVSENDFLFAGPVYKFEIFFLPPG